MYPESCHCYPSSHWKIISVASNSTVTQHARATTQISDTATFLLDVSMALDCNLALIFAAPFCIQWSRLSLYTIDVIYHYRSQGIHYASLVTQRQFDLLSNGCGSGVLQSVRRNPRWPPTLPHSCHYILLGKPYEGVIIDRRLSFTDYVTTKLQQARGVRTKIFSIISLSLNAY